MKTCKQCKATIHKDAKKCQHCGSVQGWTSCAKGCLALIIFVAVIFLIGKISSDTPTPTPAVVSETQTSVEALEELAQLMDLGKTAGVIISYDFLKKPPVVLVGSVWYTQTVAFKKDFLAKVAMLKDKILGYKYFEVRDAYSNKKVAEVTSSGSLEVYK